MGKIKYRASLRKKLVLGVSGLACITYGFSAIFIFLLNDYLMEMLGWSQQTILVFTLISGLFWSSVLAFFAAGYITKPIREVEQAARYAASGHLHHDVKVSKSDDEIRALGLAYNEMLSSLRLMVKDIEGNFEKTNVNVTELTSATEVAATRAEQIGKTMDEISQGAENSAHSITNTVSSIEDITSIAVDVQNLAETSKRSSTNMVGTLTSSLVVVNDLIDGIKQLAHDNQQSLTVVSRLDKQAKEVGEIISLVGDIAEQTNLLALNASIEAARAGEQGRGFAVVADEVRKLADESARAVQGITKLVHNIQEEVANVVTQINSQVKKANEQSQKGTETTTSIQGVERSVQEVESYIQEISVMINKQMSSIKQTNEEAQEVAAIAEETSAGSNEVSSMTEHQANAISEINHSANQLREQAKRLKETIEKFTI
ncbi:methyl-accepting chemotaxis protein [Bacillus sp. TS-2]|nr:methyl-accepting chemotaxis protein [Bacillus sp. TS-2]